MMNRVGKAILISVLIVGSLTAAQAQQHKTNTRGGSEMGWQQLAKGLNLGIFLSPQPSQSGDSLIRVLQIDPKHFRFRLLNASAFKDGQLLTAKQWCRKNDLIAAINASMYQTDGKTSVSLMRTKSHINNPRLSKDKTILAFDRQSPEVPVVKIIDRECEDFRIWKKKYGTLVQSIRMISCKRKNVWRQQPQKWSTAAIGVDQHSRILFMHVSSPFSTHDLINILLQLPLNISRAMYCEGGPQSQLYIGNKGKEYNFVGGFDIKLNTNINNPAFWPIPNVVGISRRKESIQ